jgi:hypothetical protein
MNHCPHPAAPTACLQPQHLPAQKATVINADTWKEYFSRSDTTCVTHKYSKLTQADQIRWTLSLAAQLKKLIFVLGTY